MPTATPALATPRLMAWGQGEDARRSMPCMKRAAEGSPNNYTPTPPTQRRGPTSPALATDYNPPHPTHTCASAAMFP